MVSLISAAELSDFPGSPFDPVSVHLAGEIVRAEAGWHIAPVITETVTVEANGSREILLPSLRVVSVDSIAGIGTSDWVLHPGGVLYRAAGWAWGVVSVTLTHGFDSVPYPLLPVIASRAKSAGSQRDPSVTSVSVGQVRTTYEPVSVTGGDPAISRYSVRTRVA